MRSTLLFLAGLASSLGKVSCSIYVTQPVAGTIYSATNPALVVWKEDLRKPLLTKMGSCKINLYEQNRTAQKFLAKLADDVKPTQLSHTLALPLDINYSNANHSLRFICKNPPTTFYTASFTINNADTFTPKALNPNSTLPQYTLVLSGTTIITQLPARTQGVEGAATTVYANPLSPGHGGDTAGIGQIQSPSTSGAGISLSKMVDVERLKFRLVFIVWPALIGISMAL